MSATLPVFLTAYDPPELPGGTVDPLGFTAGYLALTDALFPGMTAAAAQATYFPMLCAGIFIADSEGCATRHPEAEARKKRIDVALRFERLWALACGLQDEGGDRQDQATGPSKTDGLRGITYVQSELERLDLANAKEAGTRFALLAEQFRYGAFGIYGGVAGELGLLDKAFFRLTTGFGEAIGKSFLFETTDRTERKELVCAALDDSATVRLATLRSWGERAHAGAPLRGEGRALLEEAVLRGDRRPTFALLEKVAKRGPSDWSDRALLRGCATLLGEEDDPKLYRRLMAAYAYDAFLRNFTLLFERALWLCRRMNDSAPRATVLDDPVLQRVFETTRERAGELVAASNRLLSLGRRELLTRGRDILAVAERCAHATDAGALLRIVIQRHTATQNAKIERGRPKQPWLEERGSELALTSSLGDRAREPTSPDEIRAPDWRFAAALSFLRVTGRVRHPEAS